MIKSFLCKKIPALLCGLFILMRAEAQGSLQEAPLLDPDQLILQMTLEEKINFISGGPRATIRGIERLGLRMLRMSDGPLGVKAQVEGEKNVLKKATGFPSAITMASTWNTTLLEQIGQAIGRESHFNGIDILLGPSVNIHRVQQNGRNFEYFGEDPYLSARMSVPYIKGVQREGVLADVKHFAANNTEFNRYKSNSVVDERTLREIYLPAFEAAILEADCATIMTAHNLLNGVHCSENSYLLDTVLRRDWGFEGFVISDWNSTYQLAPTVKSGVDIEMPMGKIMSKDELTLALNKGLISEADLDKKVRRILATCIRFHLYDQQPAVSEPSWEQNFRLAVKTAEQGTVLLKNENNLLPLDQKKIKTLVIAGAPAISTPAYGGGAAGMPAPMKRNLLDEIREAAGKSIEIRYIEKKDLSDETTLRFVKNADAVITAAGFDPSIEGEAHDRPFNLPADQVDLIRTLSVLNPRTIVALFTGGGVNMLAWAEKSACVLAAWYQGDATGHVLGRMLFGAINPSGKLPISIENKWEDAAAYASYDKSVSEAGMPALFKPAYEKLNGPVSAQDMIPMPYTEGIMTGYRHFTTKKIKPLFPFGFGLSYTSFQFTGLTVQVKGDSVSIRLNVKNTGQRAGAEVVQVYLQDEEASVERPVIELKRFERVELMPGETRTVAFQLHVRDLSFWDVLTHSWKAEPGTFIVHAGNSSENLPLQKKFNWK